MKLHEIEARRPREVLTVPAFIWAETWHERPREPVAVGLRNVSEGEVLTAQSEALRHANEIVPSTTTHPKIVLWTDAYNDFLMRQLIARSVCDPNDVTAPSEALGAAPEEFVLVRLNTPGVSFLFREIERFRIATDTSRREATNEEIETIVDRFATLEALPKNHQARVRRVLAWAIDQLPIPE